MLLQWGENMDTRAYRDALIIIARCLLLSFFGCLT